MTGPILISGLTNTDTLWELEPILEPTYGIIIQPIYLIKGVKSLNYPRGRDGCIPPPPPGLSLDDNPVSSSLDRTSTILLVSPLNQAKD